MQHVSVGLLAFLLTTAAFAEPPADVVVRPAPAPGPLDNPLKGWCPYTNAGSIRQPYSMVFQYAPWSELEPEEGHYAFDAWERRAWSVPAAEGKHVVFRVYVDYPSRPSGLPAWLKAKGVKLTPYTEHRGGSSPDYDDPRMLLAMERLIAALGHRYDADPRVAFVQLGLLGFWGEWHTWPRDKLYASKATERRVIAAYHAAFPHKVLLARYARDAAGEQPWLGFHDDMFPEDTENGQDWSFLAGLRRAGRADNWKRAAIGGEMVPLQAAKWLGNEYEQSLRMIERGHFTWIGPYCPALDASPSPEFRHRSEALVRRMGYQFRLTEVRLSGTLAQGRPSRISLRGENEGVAPFYYPWPLELAWIDPSGKVLAHLSLECDVREWLPGRFHLERSVTPDVPPGRYRLALGLIDPWTRRPAIGLANHLERVEGWNVLASITVGPSQ